MTTSPALPTPATSAASRPTSWSRLAPLRRRIPTVALFAAVSFSGWTIDYALVLILNSLTGSVLYSVTGARIVSCALGFLLNRRLFRAAPETLWALGRWLRGGPGRDRGDLVRRHRGPHRGRSTSVAGQGARGLHALHRQLPGPVPPRLPGPGGAVRPGAGDGGLRTRLRLRTGHRA